MEITRNEQLRDYISEIMVNEYMLESGYDYSLTDFGDYLAIQNEDLGMNEEVFEYADKCNDKFIEWFKGFNPGAVFENGEFILITRGDVR